MKRKILMTLLIVVAVAVLWLIGTGFMERTDVYLADYSVSPSGEDITLHVGIGSSVGYTRGFRDEGGGVKSHYLHFYQAFGGFNSSLGAKNVFVLEVGEDDNEIYFSRFDGGYQLVLYRDEEVRLWNRG